MTIIQYEKLLDRVQDIENAINELWRETDNKDIAIKEAISDTLLSLNGPRNLIELHKDKAVMRMGSV